MADSNRYSRQILRLIVFTVLIRCLVSFAVGLGNDEAYYFTYALQPDWNHFDHPPLVGLFIRLFTGNLHWVNEWTMRLTGILGAAVNTWLIAQCGRLIRNERAGWIAAVLYNTSIYTSIIAGVFILPDSPQVVFWMLSLYTMIRIIQAPPQEDCRRRLTALGCWIGLATLCKVHGIFLWGAFGCFLLFHDRRRLRDPFLYLSFLITLCLVSPVVWWNFHNHFVTYRFHSGRIALTGSGVNLSAFLTSVAGQLFYNNPFNVILYGMAVVSFFKRKPGAGKETARLLLWSSLPLILLVTGISLFRDTLPHWSGPAFLSLILLASAYAADTMRFARKTACGSLLAMSTGFIIFVLFAGVLLINFYPGTPGSKKLPALGKGDITLDMYGWRSFSSSFARIRAKDIASGNMLDDAPVVVHKWFPGGQVIFYAAYPLGMRVVGVGTLQDLHKFAWLNRQNGYIKPGMDAYFIVPSNYYSDPHMLYKNDFDSISAPIVIPQERLGHLARYWYVYRLKGARRLLGDILHW